MQQIADSKVCKKGVFIMKKIIAINAGPRKGWNTDKLVSAAARGAEDAGAEVEYIDLFKLDRFTGCISCFGCKREESFGKCACRDGLSDVLAKIRNSDGLIIGSPIYLGETTSSFRALFERLVFQYLTYNKERPCCNEHMIPVTMIVTSNCDEGHYDAVGYTRLFENYRQMLERFVGPAKLLACGNTLQVNDYSKYNWTQFDVEAKIKYHDESFDGYLNRAYEMGKALCI